MPDINTIFTQLSVWAVPVLLAITLHEAAHGFVAKKFGDPTAFALGRVTLNPLKHIDPLGTVLMPLLLLVAGLPVLGYAKPVPVNFSQLRPWRGGVAAVALAGPAANLLLLVVSILLLLLVGFLPQSVGVFMVEVLKASVAINIILMVFNLLPIPPLDGGRVLQALLPKAWSYQLARYEWMGMFLVLFLLITGVLFYVLNPLVVMVYAAVGQVLNLFLAG